MTPEIRPILLNLVQEGLRMGKGRCYALLLGRKGVSKEFFFDLLFLSCLKLKIINMPKWHILGVVPFNNTETSITFYFIFKNFLIFIVLLPFLGPHLPFLGPQGG